MTPSTDIVPLRPETTLPTERLETEITSLAAHIHAATARWLAMVAEYDRRRGWADWGCRSCAHWLAWRCGLGLRAAREHVRVARGLVDLPVIQKEFEAGRFSFSQVRALTRVATSENEAELADIARRAPAAQLEGMVRAFSGAVRAQELKDAKGRQATRHLTYYFDDDGSFVINGRLSPEDGVIVKEALDRIAEPMEEEGCSAEHLEGEVATETLEELGETAFASDELDSWDARAQNERDEARRRFFDAAVSQEYTRRAADALVRMAEATLSDTSGADVRQPLHQVNVHVDLGALTDDTLGRSELENGAAIATETMRRLSCDASIVSVVEKDGKVLSAGRKTRTIPTPIKRALRARDRHCRFPGCTNKAWVDAHHIEHWAHGGEHKLENLCLLCRAHHRAVHEYGFDVRVADRQLVFYRPDGSTIERPEPMASDPRTVVALNDQLGLDIDGETCVPVWCGEKWDYDVTVAKLMDELGESA